MDRLAYLEGLLEEGGPSSTRIAKKWKSLPEGWTDESVQKFWNSLTDRAPKHPVSRCIREMDGKVSNPGAFCGGLADQMIPGWREEAAKEKKKASSPLQTQPDYGEGEAALPREKESAYYGDPPTRAEALSLMRGVRKGGRVNFDKGPGHRFGGTEYEKMEDGPRGKWLMASGQTGNLPWDWESHPEWLQSADDIVDSQLKYTFAIYRTANRVSPSRVAGNYRKMKSASYYDSEGNKLSPAIVSAVQSNNPKTLAQALDAKYGDDAYLVADAMHRVVREILTEAGLDESAGESAGTLLLRGAENEAWKLRRERAKAEIASSPWTKELKALKGAFTATVTPSDVPYIKYQPRKKKGIYTSVLLEDLDSRLGNTRTSMDESWARQHGTTLKRVFEALDELGAKLVRRGMGPGTAKPWTDYDGWAY